MKKTLASKKMRIVFSTAALLLAVAAVLLIVKTCSIPEYYVLSQDEITANTKNNEYACDEQRVFVESALSLVGKVSYFWGGKSYKLGWNNDWGKMKLVTSPGHSTSDTEQPFGLDCSGFVSWCYIQLGHTKQEMIDSIGNGTWNQWEKSSPISKRDVRLGDVAFINKYPGSNGNHIGICVGFLESGEPLIAHCSNTMNCVVVSNCGDEFIYFRRPAFLSGNAE